MYSTKRCVVRKLLTRLRFSVDVKIQNRSRNSVSIIDDGYTIRSAVAEKPMLQANFTALRYRRGVTTADQIFALRI